MCRHVMPKLTTFQIRSTPPFKVKAAISHRGIFIVLNGGIRSVNLCLAYVVVSAVPAYALNCYDLAKCPQQSASCT